MARKQFVSSRKNAPGRGVSSKEAALHGRTPVSNGTNPDDNSDIDGGSLEDDGIVDSAVSSVNSSPISSEDGAENDVRVTGSTHNVDVEGGDDNDDVDAKDIDIAASVQVVSAGVGRGKQLRFPTMISRGKESRVLFNGSDREGSDSESYASVASDEEDENVDDYDDPIDEVMVETVTVNDNDPEAQSSRLGDGSSPAVKKHTTDTDEEVICSYSIKAIRARKRHRPDSGYFRHMSTHVRDCLLSVRDTASAVDVLGESTHLEFRRKLNNGTVERVEWKEASPPPTSTSDSDKKKKMTSTDVIEKEKPRKRDKHREEQHQHSIDDTDTRSTSVTTRSERSEVVQDVSKRTQALDKKTNAKAAVGTTNGRIEDSNGLCSQCHKPSIKKESTSTVDSFIIPPPTMMDVKTLRDKVAKLYEEARGLKHAGNDKGKSMPGPSGQVAQGKYYLRSSAKFFQQALVFADLKVAYRDLKDDLHARQFGENCVKTLAQTSTLIESTIRTFQSAGSTKFVALGYKLAAIVHLTIYRFQHLKLFSLYSDLFTPGRSPDTRQSGTTPPVGGSDSQELVKTHLLKEMEHTLRGFEMWRRYEACKVVVLPRITNPAITDLNVLFEDLHTELES